MIWDFVNNTTDGKKLFVCPICGAYVIVNNLIDLPDRCGNCENAIIDGVELAIDCGYDLPEEHLKIYYDLIKRRNEQNELQSKAEIPKSK